MEPQQKNGHTPSRTRKLAAVAAGVVLTVGIVVGVAASASRSSPPRAGGYAKKIRAHFDHAAGDRRRTSRARRPSPRACLDCHPDAANVMKTAHWHWLGDEVTIPGHDGTTPHRQEEPASTTSASRRSGNEISCTKCHAGYGWCDDTFDFSEAENVDCLVCHEHTGTYVKGVGGLPTKDTDLAGGGPLGRHAAARELPHLPRLRRRRPGGEARRPRLVARAPLRRRGRAHRPLRLPLRRLPHGARPPAARPRLLGERRGRERRGLHRLPLDARARRRAPQRPPRRAWPARPATSRPTPRSSRPRPRGTGARPATRRARRTRTSTCKIKGEFTYEQDALPEYRWFNLSVDRYLLGDKIDATKPAVAQPAAGDIRDPSGAHLAVQGAPGQAALRRQNAYLLAAGDRRQGRLLDATSTGTAPSASAPRPPGLAYSGKYGFARHRDVLAPLPHGRAQGAGARLHRLPRRAIAPGLEGPGLRRRPDQDRRSPVRPLSLISCSRCGRCCRAPRRPWPSRPSTPSTRSSPRSTRPASRTHAERASRPTPPAAPATTCQVHRRAQRPRRRAGQGHLRPVPPRRRQARGRAAELLDAEGRLKRDAHPHRHAPRAPTAPPVTARHHRGPAAVTLPRELRGRRPRPVAAPARSRSARAPSSRRST